MRKLDVDPWFLIGVLKMWIGLCLWASGLQMTTMGELGLAILVPPLARLCIDAKDWKQYHLVLRLSDHELCKLYMTKKSVNRDAGNRDRKRNIPPRKPETYLMLSDIYEDPESYLRARCEITGVVNVDRRFVPVIEDKSDDDNVTLAEYFRKQKGVEITDKKKKKKMTEVDDPRVDQIKKSKQRFKDSMAQQKKDFRFAKVFYTGATENENEDTEVEALMLLASHFNKDEQTLSELKTNTTSVCVKSGNKSISVATKNPVVYDDIHKKIAGVLQDEHNSGTVVCYFNRNPAEFSLPDAESVRCDEDGLSKTLLHISAEDEAFIAVNHEIDDNSFQRNLKTGWQRWMPLQKKLRLN
ncbi:hypothetical protein L1987_31548 [Smallanthus sonchifolius]|uniref:Uncharacterized protein n=1 Tax=Smallanthus sonchifolius TaxID=185202 RepID=A0ACB9I8M0_9ASTR|nr:hypothetical protein L1987_31548 [Smallanthus sonchifolius]